jgi:hypothetical protein
MIRKLMQCVSLLSLAFVCAGLVLGCGGDDGKELEKAEGGALTQDTAPREQDERAESGAH